MSTSSNVSFCEPSREFQHAENEREQGEFVVKHKRTWQDMRDGRACPGLRLDGRIKRICREMMTTSIGPQLRSDDEVGVEVNKGEKK
ncbi:Protein of unknown function [Pyronema omphalodes CBS 100304]|uniref:Uncharacterized protein n=1 Tax=Pyronema omphalodes (strain CBS 100304) TaxID=1076935 RepID=U4LHH3_PYROM|nr:Protein of unknown function [Pyronema omphalodes CBS 100304]